jgi:hypothetical protein
VVAAPPVWGESGRSPTPRARIDAFATGSRTHHRLRARLRTLALACGVLGVLLACVFLVPSSLVSSHAVPDAAARLKLQNDIRTTLLQGLGGIVLLIGAYLTWRQLQVNREGQVTERFTRSIDQLGHQQTDVRLGGIYALERIARNSPDDRATIHEILTAYVRTHSPWTVHHPVTHAALPSEPDSEQGTELPLLRIRAADVQAAMNVLGRRLSVPGDPSEVLELQSVDLRFAYLAGANLQGAILGRGNLARANLMDSDLRRAHLRGVNLRDALLAGANLENANLANADLAGSIFRNANIRGVNFSDANLDGADFTGAEANAGTRWPKGFMPSGVKQDS